MEKLRDIVDRVLKEKQWPSSSAEDNPNVLALRFRGQNAAWLCNLLISEEPRNVRFYSHCPADVGQTHRTAMLELLSSLNWELPQGCFAMNLETGEVIYRTTLDLDAIPGTDEAVWRLILVNVATFDQFLPALLDIIK